MARTAKISLHWLLDNFSSNRSSRGQRFVCPARFDHQGDDWKSDAWSLVIETVGVPDEEGIQTGTARFLIDNAPHNWLSEGKKFTLFEDKALAEGEVKQVLSDPPARQIDV